MTEISHILVLSQPGFLQRQVDELLSERRTVRRGGIAGWLGFRKRDAAAH
jgi:hypothetical protein